MIVLLSRVCYPDQVDIVFSFPQNRMSVYYPDQVPKPYFGIRTLSKMENYVFPCGAEPGFASLPAMYIVKGGAIDNEMYEITGIALGFSKRLFGLAQELGLGIGGFFFLLGVCCCRRSRKQSQNVKPS